MSKQQIMVPMIRDCCDFCGKPEYPSHLVICPFCEKDVCIDCGFKIPATDFRGTLYLCPDCKDRDITKFDRILSQKEYHYKQIERLNEELDIYLRSKKEVENR